MKIIIFFVVLFLTPLTIFAQSLDSKIIELRDSIASLKEELQLFEGKKGFRCTVFFKKNETDISLKINGKLFPFDACSADTIKVFFIKGGTYTIEFTDIESGKKATLFTSITEQSRFLPNLK